MSLAVAELVRLGKAVGLALGVPGAAITAAPWLVEDLATLSFVTAPQLQLVLGLSCLTLLPIVRMYRNSLHRWPSFLTMMVFAIVLVVVLVLSAAVDAPVKTEWARQSLAVGRATASLLAIVALCASLSVFSARELVYRRLFGQLTDSTGRPARNVRLSLELGRRRPLIAITNRNGGFQFLLTRQESLLAGWLDVARPARFLEGAVLAGGEDADFPLRKDFVCTD